MNKLKKIILCIIVVFCFSCKDNAQKNTVAKEAVQKVQNFDNMLKCGDYSYDENYFVTADYGCVYKQKGNNYGNIVIYLVPKNKLNITDEQIENENNRVNGLSSIDEYKKEFKIVLFLIDSKYLNYVKSGEPAYYQKSEYEEKAYRYDDKQSKWTMIDSIKVLNDSQNKNEQSWRKKIVSQQSENKQNSENPKQNDVSEVIKDKESKNFSLEKKQVCDLNNDNLKDFILVFKNNKEFDSDDMTTKSAPIIVLLNKSDGSYTQFENDEIYPNNFNDYFKSLVIKDSFFTVELSNEDPNNYNVDKYITFNCNKDDILLHKYSEITYSSNGKTTQENYSNKNFGIIKFGDFNSNTILDKMNK